MNNKIEHKGYTTEQANILTVGLAPNGEPKFDGPKISSDAVARTAALKAWEKNASERPGDERFGYQEDLPFHLGYLWRCEDCFEGIFYSHDFPTVKLTSADDLGPCARCGWDLNAGGAWMNLSQGSEEGELGTALHVVGVSADSVKERCGKRLKAGSPRNPLSAR